MNAPFNGVGPYEELSDSFGSDQISDRDPWPEPPPPGGTKPKAKKPANKAREGGISQDALALAFEERFGGEFLFDRDAGTWHRYEGHVWRGGCDHVVAEYTRELARQNADGEKSGLSATFIRGAEWLARNALCVASGKWDTDPMLLGTTGGTVDLRTGQLSAARPGDFITKLTGVAPEQGPPVLWLRFLNESLGGQADAIRFARQWFGYCLTGDTREHALAFAYGPGGNGKSVWLNTMTAIMGDYAVNAAMETFTASKHDRHSTELAMLRGARLVTASETEEGRAWAEARIKTLTGGDKVTARFMHRNNFEFRPHFKLTIAGNHAPRLANVDDAMRRRFNIVPFTNKPASPDRELEDKLKAEHGRILTWAIEGCLDWQANGLIRPAAVQEATAEYFEGEDFIGQWLADRCEVDPKAWEVNDHVFADWTRYAAAHGEAPGTANSFGKKMAAKGFATVASSGVRKRVGLRLRSKDGGEHDR